jgi:hypothetical protein
MNTVTIDQTKYICGFCHIPMGVAYCESCNEYKGAMSEEDYAKFVAIVGA